MRAPICIFALLSCLLIQAQDKLFFNNGTIHTGTVVSMGRDVLYFKGTDTSVAQRIKKSDLLMLENYKGVRYLFGRDNIAAGMPSAATEKRKYRNILSLQPLALFLGRAFIRYEYMSEDGKIGIAFPIALSFNPYQNLTRVDTVNIRPKAGVNMLGGIDLNFYMNTDEDFKFFIGPRFRYGTDVLLLNTEGYSLQTQCGWKFENDHNRLVQHLSIGFGVLKVLSSAGMNASRRTYGCYSINYSIGLKW